MAKVLSTKTGTGSFRELAAATTAGTSATSTSGLPMVSTYQSLVFSLVAATKASMSLFSTKVVSTPRSPRVCRKMFQVPPYRESEATMWSPAPTILVRAKISAAWPEATATAPVPPSMAATRAATASGVVLVRRP